MLEALSQLNLRAPAKALLGECERMIQFYNIAENTERVADSEGDGGRLLKKLKEALNGK